MLTLILYLFFKVFRLLLALGHFADRDPVVTSLVKDLNWNTIFVKLKNKPGKVGEISQDVNSILYFSEN